VSEYTIEQMKQYLKEEDNKIFIRVDFLEELLSQLILNILEIQKRDIEENIRKFDLK